MNTNEVLKLALEALQVVTRELLAVTDELAERGGRPKTNVFHQRLWDSSHAAYTDKAIPAAIALREALSEDVPETNFGNMAGQPAQQAPGVYLIKEGSVDQHALYKVFDGQNWYFGAADSAGALQVAWNGGAGREFDLRGPRTQPIRAAILSKQDAKKLVKIVSLARKYAPQPAQQETINGRTVAVDWKAQALELREIVRLGGIKIAELEAALAQQQEPVAWMHEWEDGERIPTLHTRDSRKNDKPKSVRPLVYGDTSPQPAQRKPLTDDEMDNCLRRSGVIATFEALRCVGREVEAAHGIKENKHEDHHPSCLADCWMHNNREMRDKC